VPMNKSQILRLDVAFSDLLVGNPDIADVLALTDRSIYVLGKSLGSTSLTIYGPNRQLIAVADLVVSQDIEAMKARLYEIMPDETIEIRPANGGLILSGTVSTADRMSRALAVAERMAPGAITNLMRVGGSQQVMLSVRFAEVSRSVSKSLGNSFQLRGDGFTVATNAFLGPSPSILSIAGFGGALGTLGLGTIAIDALFDALEEKNLVKTLAEPNLIALSGDTANFLAGGEFPVPVAQDANNAITIEFKQFGVGLAFTPTVLDDGLMNIVVSPEVSTIDNTNAVTVSGFTIPGLTVRRATTTVELRDGQSFAIAGLLQSNFTDGLAQLPWAGEIPVLGALFRSANYQRNETELMIIVTPHLVRPAPAGALATPVDNFMPPNDFDLFAMGRLEDARSGRTGTRATGGIAGQFGHIIK
jgi:pilus assembly protein CpaC